MTPDQLEGLIAWYFKKKGADIYDILPKNYSEKVEQEDADVLAIFEDLKLRIFVQAKAYKDNGKGIDLSHAEEQLNKYMKYHVMEVGGDYTDIKWIICLAKSNNEIKTLNSKDVRVITGTEFAEMLLQAGLQNIDDALM